ncbi:MAG: hypothetical protein J1F42_11855 [Lachnospiraceae bacterium]|nr:hypothetical protein [Lachnospiraceae bacterium]
MKNKKIIICFSTILTLLWFFPITAFANSSWMWISETRPDDLLPFVIAGTLLIEILAVRFVAGINNFKKIIPVTVISNLVSFVAPYLLMFITVQTENSTVSNGTLFTFKDALEKWPFYTVGLAFLIMTLACEMPIVYNVLKKETKHRKKLASVIIGSNLLTTVLTAIVERTLCYGRW